MYYETETERLTRGGGIINREGGEGENLDNGNTENFYLLSDTCS